MKGINDTSGINNAGVEYMKTASAMAVGIRLKVTGTHTDPSAKPDLIEPANRLIALPLTQE
jgi:hypothetical protein